MHRSLFAITLLVAACADETEPSNAPLAIAPADSASGNSGGAIPSGEDAQDQTGNSNGASSSGGDSSDNTSSMSGGAASSGGQNSNSGDLGQGEVHQGRQNPLPPYCVHA